MTKLLQADLTYALRGVGFRIHNALGPGHSEQDYEKATAWGLHSDGIPFLQQPVYRLDYKNWQIGEYRPDFMIGEKAVLVDLKATSAIESLHKAQMLSYLRVTDVELGLLMNFGGASMQFARLPNFLRDRKVVRSQAHAPTGILYPEITNGIIDALSEVHYTLGPGFLHQVYRRAARRELIFRNINFTYIKTLPLCFENYEIGQRPIRLFFVEQKLLVATVSLQQVTDVHQARLRWAMRQLHCSLGLIANFYPTELQMHFVRLG